jgi:hypothetical protein
MSPRQGRRERREAQRKAKKLELKKIRLEKNHSHPAAGDFAVPVFLEVQPCPNPELEHEVPRAEEVDHNSIADRISLQAGLPMPSPGPSPSFKNPLAKRNTLPPPPPSRTEEIGFVSQRRTESNRANAQLSTGPRTPDGKLASSRNSTKHGLASGTLLIPGEDPAGFEALLNDLLEEHQPATPTEDLLVKEMAQSYWLTQRAIQLQNTCFTEESVNGQQLALFLRYQTTHERRFYKALNCLLQLKKEAARTEPGFVPQRPAHPADPIRFVSQNSPDSPQDGSAHSIPRRQKATKAA